MEDLKDESPQEWRDAKDLFYTTRCGWTFGFVKFEPPYAKGILWAGGPAAEGTQVTLKRHGRLYNGYTSPFDVVGVRGK